MHDLLACQAYYRHVPLSKLTHMYVVVACTAQAGQKIGSMQRKTSLLSNLCTIVLAHIRSLEPFNPSRAG